MESFLELRQHAQISLPTANRTDEEGFADVGRYGIERNAFMIRVGIIGCGKIAQTRHIPEYMGNPYTEIVGYFDSNHARAARLAQENGGTAFVSVDALLTDPTIDAVSICTANHTHAELSIRALRVGKHVLCEKPMATTLQDCNAMVAAANETGRILMIDQNQRLLAAHRKAKELVVAGAIGKILTFRTTFGHSGPESWSVDGSQSWFFDKKKAAMGALADLGVHKTDLIQYLTGSTIVAVNAVTATLDKRDPAGNPAAVDDNAICIYRMDNGILGTMTASWTYYGFEDNSTVLYGTEGIMRIYDKPDAPVQVITKSGETRTYQTDWIQTNDNQTASGVIDAFVECIRTGAEPELSGASVLPAMRAVFAALEAAETGKNIILEP